MASIGNNTKSKNTELRDAFFTDVNGNHGSEGRYVDNMVHSIKQGTKYDIINHMDYKDYYLLLKAVKNRIFHSDNDIKLKSAATCVWDLLTTNVINSRILSYLNEEQNTDAKRVLGEVLVGMVEEGKFNEEQMAIVENLLGLVLHSIEDLHMENILEK